MGVGRLGWCGCGFTQRMFEIQSAQSEVSIQLKEPVTSFMSQSLESDDCNRGKHRHLPHPLSFTANICKLLLFLAAHPPNPQARHSSRCRCIEPGILTKVAKSPLPERFQLPTLLTANLGETIILHHSCPLQVSCWAA